MKNKLVLGLAAIGLTFAAANSAKAGFSLDISIGSRYPSHRPVVVAPPPVIYSPVPVDQCAPPVVVAPPPRQVIVTRPYDRYDYYRNDRRYDWRRDGHRPDYRDERRVVYRREDDHRRW